MKKVFFLKNDSKLDLFNEEKIFLIVTLFNLIPILSVKFFPTLDGPAHLYNSQIIISLLFENNSLLKSFFIFNHEPVPNWIGHLILSFFNFFFPAYIAEKILLLFYMVGLPYSFRMLLSTINRSNILFSYLIFPFTYSFLFLLGFYNFSIALIFMFIILNYWLKHYEKLLSFTNIILLFFLFLLTYFSHIFVFGVLLSVIGLHLLMNTIVEIGKDSHSIRNAINLSLRKSGALFLSSFIPLMLAASYFYYRSGNKNYTYLSSSELINWLINIKPIIVYGWYEAVYTSKIFYALVLSLIIALYDRIRKAQINNTFSLKVLINHTDIWLIVAIFILVLYFKLPTSDGSAGYVSERLGLLFYIFLIIWISTQYFRKWYILLVVILVLCFHFILNYRYYDVIKGLYKEAYNCYKASEYIKPNAIVLPLNYSDNWVHLHFSNYLGVDKPMVILENYECDNDYFPLKWNEQNIPNTLFGNISNDKISCVRWKSNAKNPSIKIDYVFLLGNIESKDDSCTRKVKQIILNNYTLVYNSECCKLYHLKK